MRGMANSKRSQNSENPPVTSLAQTDTAAAAGATYLRFEAEEFGIGSPPLPEDPEEAKAELIARDNIDAAADRDGFAAKVRRAHRLEEAKCRGLHKHEGLSWREYLDRYFAGGYFTWSRFRTVARVQAALHRWSLPLAEFEASARAIAPHLNKRNCREKLSSALNANAGTYPSLTKLKSHLGCEAHRKVRKRRDLATLVAELLAHENLREEERWAVAKIQKRLEAGNGTIRTSRYDLPKTEQAQHTLFGE